MPDALTEAMNAFVAERPDAAADPGVAEAALGAARLAADALDGSERVTYVRVGKAGGGDLDVRGALRDVRQLVHRLADEGRLRRWWWLEKRDGPGPHLRLRLHGHAPLAAADLDELRGAYDLTSLPYEPEMALFGGPAGIDSAHRFHHVDSEVLSQLHLSQGAAEEAPLGVTVRAVEALFGGAELDRFERWDVWRHVARNRPLDTNPQEEADRRWFVTVREAAAQELRDGGSRFGPYAEVGAELARLNREGKLERGPRQVIAGLVVFHGNRARAGYVTQARLAHAAAAAYDPMPNEGMP